MPYWITNGESIQEIDPARSTLMQAGADYGYDMLAGPYDTADEAAAALQMLTGGPEHPLNEPLKHPVAIAGIAAIGIAIIMEILYRKAR